PGGPGRADLGTRAAVSGDCEGQPRGLGRAGSRDFRLVGPGDFRRVTSGAAGGGPGGSGSRPRTSAGPGLTFVAGREYVSGTVQSCRESCTNLLDVGWRAVLATSMIEELWTVIALLSRIPRSQCRLLRPRLAGHRGGMSFPAPRLAQARGGSGPSSGWPAARPAPRPG